MAFPYGHDMFSRPRRGAATEGSSGVGRPETLSFARALEQREIPYKSWEHRKIYQWIGLVGKILSGNPWLFLPSTMSDFPVKIVLSSNSVNIKHFLFSII